MLNEADAIYMVSGLPLAGLALHCFGRWATKGGALWLVSGVLLGALGIDALRLLLQRVDETPAYWPWWAASGMLAVGLATISRRVWKRVSRPPLKQMNLEQALDESTPQEHPDDP